MQPAIDSLQLHAGVEYVRRGSNLLLINANGGKTVRVSPAAQPLIPRLTEGAEYEELVRLLKTEHPKIRDVRPSLNVFLRQLRTNQLLVGSQNTRPSKNPGRRFWIVRPDRAAQKVASLIGLFPAPLMWLLLASGLLMALVGTLVLPFKMALVPLGEFAYSFNILGFLLFAVVVVPLHEAAHAVACRLVGCKVTEAGIVMHGGIVPGPYVKTDQIYTLTDRIKRFWVPAAGPMVKLLAAGSCAWILLLASNLSDAGQAALAFLYAICTLFIFLDTNPFTPSDGSHMLEALLDDELARKSALFAVKSSMAEPKTMMIYRAVAGLHAVISVTMIVIWWWI